MSGGDRRICVQLPEVLDAIDPLLVGVRIRFGFEIGIPVTLLDGVADILATEALDELLLLLASAATLRVVLVVARHLVFALVLAVFAAGRVAAPLPTAPPDLARPLRLVRPATPVVIFLIVVFLVTIFARFRPGSLPFPQDQLGYPFLQFLFIGMQSEDFLL